MKRLAVVAVAILLSGCVGAGTVPLQTVVANPTKLDTRIAATTANLSRYCGVAQAVVQIATGLVVKPALTTKLNQVAAVVGGYCGASPPADLAEALQALAGAYNAFMAAK